MSASDNNHLSEAVGELLPRLGASSVAHTATDRLRALLLLSRAKNTKRAYRSDLLQYLGSGFELPARSEDVALYVAQESERLAPATLARRLVAIGQWHRAHDLSDPCKGELVRLAIRGVRRLTGVRQRQAAPITPLHLASICDRTGSAAREVRDRAILLVGFHGAFRRSELAGMQWEHVRQMETKFKVELERGKTDQERRGRTVLIENAAVASALVAWRRIARVGSGPIFTAIIGKERVSEWGLSGEAINFVVKRRLAEIGICPDRYSGHSLRSGYVTQAVHEGVPRWRIRRQTGHASDQMLDRYIRSIDQEG
ncbi:integrase [Bradyrhizobium guangdongense]|uniref:tyrosine-type recombinase/integrase n=1 Tax=Bradyrhizobium guangdongense TaxID=1325090 RepID=UPI00112793D4|nr:integrase [Bradyrhizobium guangdongense]